MNIDQLVTFIKLSEKLNYSKTADELNVTQPTVTARIKNLEEELGCKLFEVHGKTVSLTEAGKLFLVYARNILNIYNEGKKRIEQLQHMKLAVGFPPNFSAKRIMATLDSIDVSATQITIYRGVDSDELVQRVLDDTVTLAFIHGNANHEHIHEERICDVHLKFVASPGHPLAQYSEVGKQDLENDTLVCYTRHSKVWLAIEKALKGIPLRRIEANDVATVKKIVKQGIGFTILTDTSIDEEEHREFCILPVRDFYSGDKNMLNFPLHAVYKENLALNRDVFKYVEQIIHNMKLACAKMS